MGTRHYSRYDFLAVIVCKAEKMHLSPEQHGKMGIPYTLMADMLRDGSKIAPDTILTKVREYEEERLIRRMQNRPLVIQVNGNAWTKLEQIVRGKQPGLDRNTKAYEWARKRFLKEEQHREPVTTTTVVEKTVTVESVTILLPKGWRKIVEAFGTTFQLLGDELVRVSQVESFELEEVKIPKPFINLFGSLVRTRSER